MKIKDTRFIVIDTETTGLEYSVDKVVDIACVEVLPSRGIIQTALSSLVCPGIPIPPEASAVHHLTDKHVKDAPLWGEVLQAVENVTRGAVTVAHNAAFDSKFLPETFAPWLCTWRLARHLYPEAKSHSNQYLRYWFGFDIENVETHRAQGDAYVTGHILYEMLHHFGLERDVKDLFELAESPIEVRTMPFGKHRGVPMEEVPTDYIAWALRNMTNLDSDLKATFERRLKHA